VRTGVYNMAHPTCGRDQSMNSSSPGQRERVAPTSALELQPTQPPHALIIDDERSVRMALRRYFERRGWQVTEAEDGAHALRLLEQPEASAYDW